MSGEPFHLLLNGLVCWGGSMLCHVLNRHFERPGQVIDRARVLNIKDLEHYVQKGGKRPLVAVQGTVGAKHPLGCKGSAVKAVEMDERAEMLIQGSAGDKVHEVELGSTRKSVPWYLEDSSKCKAYVADAREATGFMLTHHLPTANEDDPLLHGRTLRTHQSVLPVGQLLTVVAEVSTGRRGEVVLHKPAEGAPFYVTPAPPEHIPRGPRVLARYFAGLSGMGFSLGLFFMLGSVAAALTQWERERQLCRLMERDPTTMGLAHHPRGETRTGNPDAGVNGLCGESSPEKDEAGASVVWEEGRAVFLPCGHLLHYQEWSDTRQECPTCTLVLL